MIYLNYSDSNQWYDIIDNNNKEFIQTLNEEISSVDDIFDNLEINEPIKKEDCDITNINFSIDNEIILQKINDIINNRNFKKKLSLYILKDQNFIITYITKYITQNKIVEYKFFINLLLWLKDAANELAKRLNMKKIKFNRNKMLNLKTIPRSSYKFCTYKHECNYNYDNNKKGCYADHYVHDILANDIEVLIYYIDTNNMVENLEDYKIVLNSEITKSINTISFVIKSMYDELNNISLYSINKDFITMESYHVNKKINSKSRKKKLFK